jgi:hypothetical protein
MDIMTIHRIYQQDCTVGVMNFDNFRCFTLELPQEGNQPNVSCIPEGQYNCRKITSPTLGKCIEILEVPGRSYIRIHKGNFTSQIQGCVLVGEALKDINGDLIIDVANSAVAFDKLMEATPKLFDLIIL